MKKVLITTPSLNSGGVEVSLIRFLKELSKNKDLKIDLLLLKKEGMYLKDVPNNVTLIELEYDNSIYSYNNNKDYIKNIKSFWNKFKFLIYRTNLKICLLLNKWDWYYKKVLKHVKNIEKKYDLAIDWHGYGHFVTALVASDKIVSNKKITWIHDAKIDWLLKVKNEINNFDKIFCVSKSCLNEVNNITPSLSTKTEVFYNLIDYKNIILKSKEKASIKLDNKVNLVTVGRLEWQKGYDIAIKIGKILKDNSLDFCWYIIGGGTEKQKISNLINEHGLEENFKLLGILKNPFPIIKGADIYVQPSRHEGYGLAIAEAKILGKVVVATNLDCIKEQIENCQNGLVCKLDPNDFAQTIIKVCKDKKLQKKIQTNLKKENFDYTYQFDKLYKIMED